MKKASSRPRKPLSKKSSKRKIEKKYDRIEDTPSFKKKMAEGKRMLSIAGLPKLS